MPRQLLDLDPNKLAAVLYRSEDDVDALLYEFANDRMRAGERVGGVVQQNLKDAGGRRVGMQLIDLMTSGEIPMGQSLGSGASGCSLDPAGLAEASLAVTRAIESEVALIVVNKFSKQEAAGQGLRNELADAVIAGLPVLTAVPETCLQAWTDFTGDRGTTLFCARRVIDAWWQEVSTREALMRNSQPPRAKLNADRLASTWRA